MLLKSNQIDFFINSWYIAFMNYISKISGIYIIKCKITNKLYVGQSRNINSRISTHITELFSNTHHCYELQNDFNKYGLTAFSFEFVEEISSNDNNLLISREKFWIGTMLKYFVLYNSNFDTRKERIKKFYTINDSREYYQNLTL